MLKAVFDSVKVRRNDKKYQLAPGRYTYVEVDKLSDVTSCDDDLSNVKTRVKIIQDEEKLISYKKTKRRNAALQDHLESDIIKLEFTLVKQTLERMSLI